MDTNFKLAANRLYLCAPGVPTEVTAHSSGVTAGWAITTGNSIGAVS